MVGSYYGDSANPTLTHAASFSYDPTHRLTSAVATGNYSYNLTYSFDEYGDATCVQGKNTNGPCPQYSFSSSTNRISNSGYTYDASGDLTDDGTHTYQYDAEGRLISVDNGSTASYIYNALGERVEKDLGGAYSEYVFDKGGAPVGINNRSSWTEDYIPMGMRHVAHYQNGAHFVHSDALGTTTMATSYSGALEQDETRYPWGTQWKELNGSVEERYASLQHRDSETNLDPTHYRMYSSSQYRWLRPDPMQADIYWPQSMSRYGYAGGNPFRFTDPTGACNAWEVVNGVVRCAAAVAMGGACLAGDVSTGGLATAGAVLCVSYAGSLAVSGTLNIVNGITGTNTEAGQQALESVGTLPGIYSTAFSGGNLSVGQATSTVAGFLQGGTEIVNEGQYGAVLIDLGVDVMNAQGPPLTGQVPVATYTSPAELTPPEDDFEFGGSYMEQLESWNIC